MSKVPWYNSRRLLPREAVEQTESGSFVRPKGGAEERVEMELPMDGDGAGNNERVYGVVGTFLPSIDEANKDFKCFWAVLMWPYTVGELA